MDNSDISKTLDEWKKINFVNGKPIDSTLRIVEALIPHSGEANRVRARRQIKFPSDILLLTKGHAFAYRDDDICMGVVSAPSVLGVIGAYLDFYNQKAASSFYILTASDCVYYRCEQSVFGECMETNQLWHDVARVLAARLSRVERNNRVLLVHDTRHKIISLLVELSMHPETVYKNVSILEFVQQRTNVSRSVILKIISELKNDHAIITFRGRLQSIDTQKLNLDSYES